MKNKNSKAIGVFIDMAKAFNTVDHNILINKLEQYGIRDKASEWFKNYLKDRPQCVCIRMKSLK